MSRPMDGTDPGKMPIVAMRIRYRGKLLLAPYAIRIIC